MSAAEMPVAVIAAMERHRRRQSGFRRAFASTDPPLDVPSPAFGRILHHPRANRLWPMEAALAKDAPVTAPASRVWRLYKRNQLDQGDTPQCVAYTGKHWESSLPTYTKTGLTPAELYHRCKLRDGYPGVEGTTANALLDVYRELGKIANYFWYLGDLEPLILWLLTKGGVWFGANWTPSMLTPGPRGMLTVDGPMIYGHETALIGADLRREEVLGVQSWEQPWGDGGRFRLRFADLKRLLDNGGDAAGVVEVAAA